MKGRLLVLEGIDGSGKGVQAKLLLDFLKSRKIPCESIHYPDYGNPIGQFVHGYLKGNHDLSPDVQFLLFATDMVKDAEKVMAWLNEGRTVVADRYFTSTLAFQGSRGFPLERGLSFAGIFNLPKPDVILFLKISPETCMKRKIQEKQPDRNEADLSLQKKVSESYESLAKDNVFGSWFVLDGEKPPQEVFGQIKKVLRL